MTLPNWFTYSAGSGILRSINLSLIVEAAFTHTAGTDHLTLTHSDSRQIKLTGLPARACWELLATRATPGKPPAAASPAERTQPE